MKRCRHGLLIGEPLLFLGGEAVQQEDGVIHRHCQLNDRRDTMGEEGDLPKDDIGAHVEDNGDAHGEQEQYRLKPGGGCDRQYRKDHHNTGCHDHRHLPGDTLLQGFVFDGGAAVMALLPQQFLHGIDGFIGAGV